MKTYAMPGLGVLAQKTKRPSAGGFGIKPHDEKGAHMHSRYNGAPRAAPQKTFANSALAVYLLSGAPFRPGIGGQNGGHVGFAHHWLPASIASHGMVIDAGNSHFPGLARMTGVLISWHDVLLRVKVN